MSKSTFFVLAVFLTIGAQSEVRVLSYEEALTRARIETCGQDYEMVVYNLGDQLSSLSSSPDGVSVVGGRQGRARGTMECVIAMSKPRTNQDDWVCVFVDAQGHYLAEGRSFHHERAMGEGVIACGDRHRGSFSLCSQRYGVPCVNLRRRN